MRDANGAEEMSDPEIIVCFWFGSHQAFGILGDRRDAGAGKRGPSTALPSFLRASGMTAKDAGHGEVQRAGRMPFVPQDEPALRNANGAEEVSHIRDASRRGRYSSVVNGLRLSSVRCVDLHLRGA